ncbi:MAG: DUF1376 domain-containing protein [Mangrovibacterium sp.]
MNSPAFLFYSKDWIVDTAHWEPASKGVYIDLLAHQHVNGYLPSDMRKLARVARLSPDEFERVWEDIKHKFTIDGDHVVNHRLNQVITENQTKALKNKINGCFAAKIRSLNISDKQKEELKRVFEYEMFTYLSDDKIKDSVYQWVDQMVNQVVNQTDNNKEDVNADANENRIKDKSTKKFVPPTFEEFSSYFDQNGYSKDAAERAFNGYNVADWTDSTGKPVKNWKQKCQHVWFRPENKKPNGKPQQEFTPAKGMTR